MERPRLTLLYRGPLASCNYRCGYCPFAKRQETAWEHRRDAAALERFVAWLESRTEASFSIFFIPWGEALVRARYRKALVRLSRAPSVDWVGIQTNFSAPLRLLGSGETGKMHFWATFHPGQISAERFLQHCHEARQMGASLSVGSVGVRENLSDLEKLRSRLPPDVYLWVNAFKRLPGYYRPEELQRLEGIDPWFRLHLPDFPSAGRACRCGEDVFFVNGDGELRRCPFLDATCGNLYRDSWSGILSSSEVLCSRNTCHCYIGYIHLKGMGWEGLYGEHPLARIPRAFLV